MPVELLNTLAANVSDMVNLATRQTAEAVTTFNTGVQRVAAQLATPPVLGGAAGQGILSLPPLPMLQTQAVAPQREQVQVVRRPRTRMII